MLPDHGAQPGQHARLGHPAEVRSDPAVLDAYLGGEDDPSTQLELAEDTRHAAGRVR